jgi:TATA-box binding protein (TBP) (component of TFIID and TFIIIB)
MTLYFSNYRISTITCNADICSGGTNCKMNLQELFDQIELKNENNNFVWATYFSNNQENTRGLYPKKKKKNKESIIKKRRFDNQVSFIFKFDENYYPNLKIFQNGNIQMAGPRCMEHTTKPIEILLKIINNLYNLNHTIITSEKNGDIIYDNFKIRLINTDFKIFKNPEFTIPFMIKRKTLQTLLVKDDNIIASLDTMQYPGCKIAYYWDSLFPNNNGKFMREKFIVGKNMDPTIRKVTIAVFESGSILITGGINFDQINEAYNYIKEFIIKNMDSVKMLNPLDI